LEVGPGGGELGIKGVSQIAGGEGQMAVGVGKSMRGRRAGFAVVAVLALVMPEPAATQAVPRCFQLVAGPWYAIPEFTGGTRVTPPPAERFDSLSFALPEVVRLTDEQPTQGVAGVMGARGWRVLEASGGSSAHDTRLWSGGADSLFVALFTRVPDPGVEVSLARSIGGWSGVARALEGLDAAQRYERSVVLELVMCLRGWNSA